MAKNSYTRCRIKKTTRQARAGGSNLDLGGKADRLPHYGNRPPCHCTTAMIFLIDKQASVYPLIPTIAIMVRDAAFANDDIRCNAFLHRGVAAKLICFLSELFP